MAKAFYNMDTLTIEYQKPFPMILYHKPLTPLLSCGPYFQITVFIETLILFKLNMGLLLLLQSLVLY